LFTSKKTRKNKKNILRKKERTKESTGNKVEEKQSAECKTARQKVERERENK